MAIVRGIVRDPPNDLMQALSRGSPFADVLQANWRNQLNLYRIVSFYEKEDEHYVSDNNSFLKYVGLTLYRFVLFRESLL